MAENGRNTELLRVRLLPAEAAALRSEAERRGLTLSAMVLELAAEAGLVEHRSTGSGAPRSTGPDLAARVGALEARLDALEVRPSPKPRATRAPRPAAAGGSWPVVAVPAEWMPGTGAELRAWREARGLAQARMGKLLGFTRAAYQQHESGQRTGNDPTAPLGASILSRLAEARERGDL